VPQIMEANLGELRAAKRLFELPPTEVHSIERSAVAVREDQRAVRRRLCRLRAVATIVPLSAFSPSSSSASVKQVHSGFGFRAPQSFGGS
jgi:hypothetical protein